ncbi:unnamed protein product [Echinostoma caproni]|uniref:RT_RNaseH_2 domain-containing protein n=1 Tax=Echinostoma caproni TaxID=27848 RepID=A0A183BCN8_9TREM|nr:unnamed protein product [Echinostoma caproni]
MGDIRNACRMLKCNLIDSNIPTADENSSPTYTLQTTEPNGQFVFTSLSFESGVEHRFIMDTGSSESILPKSALNAICPGAVLAPTSVRIHGVTGRQLQLLSETILCVQSESGLSIPIRFLISAHSPSILGLRAMWLLQGSITLHTNNDMPITSHRQHLIVKRSGNVGGMKVPSVKLEVDGEPIFLKRRVLPYGQREGVLKALQNMEQDGVLLERFAARNVAIRPSKCVFGVSEVEFLGFTVDSRGYHPDPTRFKPLTNIESPKDQTHLRSVMGCLQYYARFIPNFATRAPPLFRAQCSDAWEWSVEREDILRGLLRCVTDRPVLALVSPSKPTTLIPDASDIGIGAVLEHEGCPVIFISRLLDAAEEDTHKLKKKRFCILGCSTIAQVPFRIAVYYDH